MKLLKDIKKEDKSLYRVHAQGYPYKNYGLYNGLNTISGYYSITSAGVTDTVNSYQTLGMQYADKYCGVDQRSALLSLSGVKYITVSDQERANVPCDFTAIKKSIRFKYISDEDMSVFDGNTKNISMV